MPCWLSSSSHSLAIAAWLRCSHVAQPPAVFETLAAAGVVAMVGSLWRLSVEHAGMRVTLEQGLNSVLREFQGLRHDLNRDIARAESILADHETRIRKLEEEP
jgi:hypothetical protein